MVAKGELSSALFYLLLFSLGVMLSMLAFGLCFGRLQHFLGQRYLTAFNLSRRAVALLSMGLGGFWLWQAV